MHASLLRIKVVFVGELGLLWPKVRCSSVHQWKVLVTLLTRPCWLGREPWVPRLLEWAEMVAGDWLGKPL